LLYGPQGRSRDESAGGRPLYLVIAVESVERGRAF
jgi:hypothetical protein